MGGVLLTGGAFGLVRVWEAERTEREFRWQAESRVQVIGTTLRSYEESLYAMRDLLDASADVKEAEFRRAASAQLARHPGLEALEWLKHIAQSSRAQIEELHRGADGAAWFIRDEMGGAMPAPERKDYLPVLYREPAAGAQALIGVDQFSGPHQRAIARAIEEGEIAATRRIPLHDGAPADEEGLAILLPVFEKGAKPASAEERRAELRGVVRGVFRLRDLALHTVAGAEARALDLRLLDRTPAGTEPHLFSLVNGHYEAVAPPEPLGAGRGLSAVLPLSCAGRQWELHARPSAAWLAERRTIYPHAFLAAGLCFTALLASWQRQRHRRAAEIERLVATRTEELRRAQAELREDVRVRLAAEQRYRAFVEQSTEAIWHFEIEPPMPLELPEETQIDYLLAHAVIAECNDVCARMYGRERAAEMVGVRLGELMPRSTSANIAHLREYVRARFRVVDSESHEVDRQGVERVFLNNIIGIVEDGKLVGSWGTQRDMTGQRRTEQALRENEQRLRLAMEAAVVGTWEWDRRSDRLTWSDQLREILAVTPDENGGTYAAYHARIHPEDRKRVGRVFAQALVRGEEVECEYRIVRGSGETLWVVTRGAVRRAASGEILGLLGATLDVTARRLAQEERAKLDQKLQDAQKLESLGVLAGGIAHDFNNLLTGILGNASLARMDLAPTSPAQSCLAQIEQASQRAAELCKQMLAYSGKGRFVVQSLDLSQLVEDAAPLLQVSVGKNAALKFRLASNLPAVSADVTQLRQILMNLVINASDAFDGRSGVIEITTGVMRADAAYFAGTNLAPVLPEGDYVFLEVSDNGCGMDAETQKRIFDPFFTTKFTGRGLGLAAVLGIVRGHKGALKVYSEVGRGSTFKLLLPSAGTPAEALPADTRALETWRGSGVVLVVDDEETVRGVASRMLRVSGFEPVVVSNGSDAIEVFTARCSEIVAVMLDLTMPQMDGAETFTELRRIKPELKVLLMSGFNEQDVINRFAGKGLAGFLQKPFKPDALREKLRAMLG